MRKSLLIISIVILNLVSCFSQEFNFDEDSLVFHMKKQYEEYRVLKNMNFVEYTKEYDSLCIWNNERLSSNEKILKRTYLDNKEFREIAHDSLEQRIDKYKEYRNISYVQTYIELVVFIYPDSSKKQTYSSLAFEGMWLWYKSKDHNEGLLDPANLCYSLRAKHFINSEGKNVISFTMIIISK